MRYAPLLFLMLAVQISVSVCSNVTGSSDVSRSVGVKTGDWVKYVGAFPLEEHEWTMVQFSSVVGSRVNISLTFDVRTPYKYLRQFVPFQSSLLGDVATAEGNIFPYIVYPNLEIGEVVHPISSYFPYLVINGTTLGEYVGQNRNVVFATSSHIPQNMSGTLYWDRQTGVLVEVVAFVDGNAYSSMKITETNLWGYSLQSMITLHFPFLLLFVLCLLVIAFLTILFFSTMRASVDFPAGSYGLQRTATRGSQEEGSSLKQLARNLLERAGIVYLKVSKILLGLSLIFLVMGVLLLTSERQWYSSFSFAAAVCCFVTGLALHFEEWTLGSLGGRIGSFMVYSSVLIMAVGLLTGAYREVGACVPYTSVFGVGPNMINIGTAIVIERVYINPYSTFSSFMATVGFCLFFVGVLLKLRHGY